MLRGGYRSADLKSDAHKAINGDGKNHAAILNRRGSEPIRKQLDLIAVGDSIQRSAAASSFSGDSSPRISFTPMELEVQELSVDGADNGKNLNRILTDFARSIISTTQISSRNEAAKSRVRRSRKDDDKWKERYKEFAALEEMQSKNLLGSEKKALNLEKKLGNLKHAHRHATAQIASAMVQHDIQSLPSKITETRHAKPQTEIEGNTQFVVS